MGRAGSASQPTPARAPWSPAPTRCPTPPGVVFSDLLFAALSGRRSRSGRTPPRALPVGAALEWARGQLAGLSPAEVEPLVAALGPSGTRYRDRSASSVRAPLDPGDHTWTDPWFVLGDPACSLTTRSRARHVQLGCVRLRPNRAQASHAEGNDDLSRRALSPSCVGAFHREAQLRGGSAVSFIDVNPLRGLRGRASSGIERLQPTGPTAIAVAASVVSAGGAAVALYRARRARIRTPASRSACPVACVNSASTTSPCRFSVSRWPR